MDTHYVPEYAMHLIHFYPFKISLVTDEKNEFPGQTHNCRAWISTQILMCLWPEFVRPSKYAILSKSVDSSSTSHLIFKIWLLNSNLAKVSFSSELPCIQMTKNPLTTLDIKNWHIALYLGGSQINREIITVHYF